MRKSWLLTICVLFCTQLAALEHYGPKPCAEHAEAEGQSLEWMMQQILAGRDQVWDSLVPRLVPPLVRFFSGQGNLIRDQADDLTQITLIKIYENASKFDTSRKLMPWVYRIAHNEMTSWLRRRNRQRQIRAQFVDETGLMDFPDDGRNIAEDPDVFQIDREAVFNAIPSLKTVRRKQVVSLALLGLTDDDIAIILNIPSTTVRWNRHMATKELREMLTP